MLQKYLVVLIAIFLVNSVFGQIHYEINGFSEKYHAVLTVEKGYEDDIFKKGNITVLETKTNKEIISIDADELTFDLDKNGNVKTNVLALPYGEQSIIIAQDFNFDGVKDLAIMDGQYSCYHGPSYLVYLDLANTLEFSLGFTQLAQEYCGMFRVDYETKHIYTMTKSGCCWHQYSTFKVENNTPIPVFIEEVDMMDFPFHTLKTIEWEGDKQIERIEKTIDLEQDDITEILSFNLVKSNKKVIVFSINNQLLTYALLRPDETVEFSYPVEAVYENPDFTINQAGNKLTFSNENAIYEIYQHSLKTKINQIGILVKVNGKSYNLKGDLQSVKGNLNAIKDVGCHNLVKK